MFRKNVIQRTEGKTHNKSDCAQLPLGKMIQIHENVVFVCVIHAKTECLTLCYSSKSRLSYINFVSLIWSKCRIYENSTQCCLEKFPQT